MSTYDPRAATGIPTEPQRWSSFATYAITDTLAGTGLADNLAGTDGQHFAIFADGHNRQLPRLTGGRYNDLLPAMFEMNAGNFLIQLASERDKDRAHKYRRESSCGCRRRGADSLYRGHQPAESPDREPGRGKERSRSRGQLHSEGIPGR